MYHTIVYVKDFLSQGVNAGLYMWIEKSPAYTVTNANLFHLIENDIDTCHH